MTAKSNYQLPYCRLLLIGIGLELRNHVQKKSNKLHFRHAQHPLPSLQNSNAGSSTPNPFLLQFYINWSFSNPLSSPTVAALFLHYPIYPTKNLIFIPQIPKNKPLSKIYKNHIKTLIPYQLEIFINPTHNAPMYCI